MGHTQDDGVGSDKVNFQNLPSRDVKKKALKECYHTNQGQCYIKCRFFTD
jgi:hypothetical protein